MGHSMAKVERILIVGGGIAGLTAAIALRQHGFSPELIEREPAWRAAGAGIALQPNAMRLLRAFSVGMAVERAGAPLQRFKYCTSQGEVLAEIDLAELWKDVGRGAGVERTKLQEALLGELKGAHCRLGAWITTLDQKNDFVSVRFNDGRSEDYDLIIGADGIASSVRSLALSDAAPSYTGQMGWRSLAPIRHDTPDEVQFWLGEGCFFGLFPVSNKHTYGFGYINEPERRHDPALGRLKRLRERFAAFGGLIKIYLANLECDEQIHCAAIESLELDHWRKGRVVLIGDAAHASSPMMGQGGCMAIEDAVVLAELLKSAKGIEDALDAYVLRRRERVDWVQSQSGALGQSVLLPPAVRDGVIREKGAQAFQARYAPLLAEP
jgi:2-polyprenyl-6-methoxyphenol hydroxylase-like FAD-dependent oxidoreductase